MRVQGYESQVKIFLVLLLLFLGAAGVVGLNALYRTRALLLDEAEGRITSSSRAVQRELEGAGIDAGMQGPRLKELARAWSIASLEVHDARGKVVASTEPWRVGVVDPVAAEALRSASGTLASGGAVIREPAPSPRDTEYGPDRGEVVVLLALRGGAAGQALLLKAGHDVMGVRTVARQIRALAWIQAVAGLVVLGLALLFVRWVLRPYRALKDAAAQLEAPRAEAAAGPIDDPQELVLSFRSVIEKLKKQERELDRMRAPAAASGPGGLSRELLDGLTSGVLIVAGGGAIRALNPAGESILGLARGAIVGHDYRAAFAASPALLAILRDGVEAGRTHSREVVTYEGRSGQAMYLGVTVSTIPEAPDRGGGGAFCLFSDLTEIRGLQERVRLKENLAGLGEMSAGIAHEFRNSLATILGYARLIGREAEAGAAAGAACEARHADNAAAIVREVEAIGRTVNDFLRYARPTSLQPSEWDPRAAMTDLAREVARDSGKSGVEVVIGGEWPASIRADEPLLRQAFQNLLRNAVEAIPGDSGLVTVVASQDRAGRLLRVEVADSGTGIPPDVLPRLFTPFVTTKDHGTGLGLALAQKAIVSHDGAITADNADGGGARFVVTLPLQA